MPQLKPRVTVAGIALLLCAAFVPAQDPVKVAADSYKQVFDNERVRVLEVNFRPGASVEMHSHPDQVAYVLNSGTLQLTGTDGKVETLRLRKGHVVWLPAQSNSAQNTGKTMVRLAVVELKEPAKK
jgi:quercetin dioxygenase-like cupin family protein